MNATKYTPGCQTAIGAAFDGLKELINLIPTADETIKDVVEHALSSVHLIAEAVDSGSSFKRLSHNLYRCKCKDHFEINCTSASARFTLSFVLVIS